jgi:membrane protease YdiL (CAAX protease family)
MSTVTVAPVKKSVWRDFVNAHPLLVYFVMAYTLAWIAISPLVLGADGLKLLPGRNHSVIFLTLGAFAGPTLSAWFVTYVTRGKIGILNLLRGYVRWRVGIPWYAVSLLGFPLTYLLATGLVAGGSSLQTVIQHWPLLFTVYLTTLATNLVQVTLWEEPGWRGFALPRLERLYGPLKGTLLLGLLWSLWHLPAYFVSGWLGPFNPPAMIINILASILLTVLFTWVFNNARESILMAMLLHASSNATTSYIRALFPNLPVSAVLLTIGMWVLSALLVILLTRGRLAYLDRFQENGL